MRAKTRPYDVECNGLLLKVLPNVYAPTYFTDSLWFAEQLPEIVKSGSLLEIGTGTGIIAISCATMGARVVCTDVNPIAVQNARINVRRYRLSVSVRKGNLYEPLRPKERFDFIFWAHPFNNWKSEVTDLLLKSGRDHAYQGLRGYIAGAYRHLRAGGKLLLGTGDSADLLTLAAIAAEFGYALDPLREVSMQLELGRKAMIRYFIYHLRELPAVSTRPSIAHSRLHI